MSLALERVFLALAQAEDVVSRLDEQVRACAFAEGWSARLDFLEARDWGWVSGEIVDLEDLVLHDSDMDVRLPDQALRATHGLVRARRKALMCGAELMSVAGAAWLAGRRSMPPPAQVAASALAANPEPGAGEAAVGLIAEIDQGLRLLNQGETEDSAEALAEWLDFVRRVPRSAPPLLRAAVALEAWRMINPLPRQGFVGGLLVSHDLLQTRRVRSCLLGVEAGRRALPYPPGGFNTPTPARLVHWLRVLAAGAEAGLAELRRLNLARQVVVAGIGARRRHDRSADLLDLLLARPMVSAPMAAEHLGVAGHSARRLLLGLGSSLVEVSGRSRFRAWRL